MGIGSAAAIGGIGSIVGGVIGANGAQNAASTQAAAATQAQQLQATEAQNALDFQKQQFQTTQTNEAPYLAAGGNALNALQYGLGTGGNANGTGVGQGSLTTPYQSFTAPTGLTEQNDPGYQARLQLGTDTLQKSAAARGSVLTGGTAKALDTYAQDYASNEYGNVYNRALNTYGTNASNYYTGQNNSYNRLAGLTNTGQSTAVQQGQQAQAAANNTSQIDLTTGAQQGQDLQNAGAATASGYIGSANSYANGINGAANSLTNFALLNSLSGYKPSGSVSPDPLGAQNYG